jgi:hypothetical protein
MYKYAKETSDPINTFGIVFVALFLLGLLALGVSSLTSCSSQPVPVQRIYIRTDCHIPPQNREALGQAKLKAYAELNSKALATIGEQGPKGSRYENEDLDDQINQMRILIERQQESIDKALHTQFCVEDDYFRIEDGNGISHIYLLDITDSSTVMMFKELKRKQLMATYQGE